MPKRSDTDSLKSRIEKTLGVLVGRPLWAVGRSVDLAWFAFGNRRPVKVRNGVERDVGEYALHVQCPWRITLGDEVVTGRGDIFCTPEKSAEPLPPDFDWQKGNRFDRVVERVVTDSLPLNVHRVEAAHAGRVSIQLEHGYRLEVFPHDSENDEHWRFLRPFMEEPHLVVTGKWLRTE